MVAYQVRRSIAFAYHKETKHALGWWAVTVYNWARTHSALPLPLPRPQGKKSTLNAPLQWHSV
jgi:hypothetical protein